MCNRGFVPLVCSATAIECPLELCAVSSIADREKGSFFWNTPAQQQDNVPTADLEDQENLSLTTEGTPNAKMMATFGGDVAVEQQEKSERALRNRRARDEARRKRFLDSRKRILGVDKSFLDQQVAEKEARKAAEREAERLYGKFISRILRPRGPR